MPSIGISSSHRYVTHHRLLYTRTHHKWQVREQLKPSFDTARTLLAKIDELSHGPDSRREVITATGDLLGSNGRPMTEEMDIWFRDPVAAVRELLANSSFKSETTYRPCRIYTSEDRKNRVYNETNTGGWWWNTQVSTAV